MTHTPTAQEIYLLEQARLLKETPSPPISSADDDDFKERRALLRRITHAELAGQDVEVLRADVRRLADEFVTTHGATTRGRK